jgi:hypothetical protein
VYHRWKQWEELFIMTAEGLPVLPVYITGTTDP